MTSTLPMYILHINLHIILYITLYICILCIYTHIWQPLYNFLIWNFILFLSHIIHFITITQHTHYFKL